MRLIALAFVSVACLGLVTSPARAQEESDTANQLYQEGADLASQGKWADARAKFQAAVELRATPVGLFNLAQAERNLGLLATAKRHFVSARSLAERDGAEDVRRLSDEALASLATRVPRVTLTLPPDAAKVEARVDDRPVEIVGGELELDPGRHRLTITAAGEKPFVKEIRVADGQRLAVAVEFAKERPALPPAPKPELAPAPAAPDDESPSRTPIGAIVLGGVGAASLVVAGVLQIRRNDALDDAAAGCTRTGNGWRCPAALENDPAHLELKDKADKAEGRRAGGWRRLVGAGLRPGEEVRQRRHRAPSDHDQRDCPGALVLLSQRRTQVFRPCASRMILSFGHG
jgi:hypothetical protein